MRGLGRWTPLFLVAPGLAAQSSPGEGAGAGGPGATRPLVPAERPFTTGRASTLPDGLVRLEGGARFTFDRRLPLSGLAGDLLELEAGLALGLGDRVEARIEGVAWQRMEVATLDPGAPLAGEVDLQGDDDAQDAGDFTLATRVRLAGDPSRGLASAVQVGVRLPIAGNESGLGRDVTDAAAALLVGWRGGLVRLGAEAGFAILGSPERRAAQEDQGRLGLVAELEPPGGSFALGLEARTAFGDEGPGNELTTELVAGGRLRLASLWADLAYRRALRDVGSASTLQAGLSRTFW